MDKETAYSEAAIVSKRSAKVMVHGLENIWILKHRTPRKFSADSEFTKELMKKFLAARNIALADRAVLRHNKTGMIERKHRTVKLILEKLQIDSSTASNTVFLARATFLSNIFSGSSILSAFELVRGYSPALFGAGHRLISPDLIDTYKDREYVRALQRMLKSGFPNTINPNLLLPGTPIYYFYKSSKHSEPVERRPGRVTSAKQYCVQILNQRDKQSNVAYEDI